MARNPLSDWIYPFFTQSCCYALVSKTRFCYCIGLSLVSFQMESMFCSPIFIMCALGENRKFCLRELYTDQFLLLSNLLSSGFISDNSVFRWFCLLHVCLSVQSRKVYGKRNVQPPPLPDTLTSSSYQSFHRLTDFVCTACFVSHLS